MTHNKYMRNCVVNKAAIKGVMDITHGNYPAPLTIIDTACGSLDNPSEGYKLRYSVLHVYIIIYSVQYYSTLSI